MAGENCENCGRAIGKLEQAHVWRKHVVCGGCYAHLSAAARVAAPRSAPLATPPPLPTGRAAPIPYEPNTGERGRPVVVIASLTVAGVLLLLGLSVVTFLLARQRAVAPVVATPAPPVRATAPAAPATSPVAAARVPQAKPEPAEPEAIPSTLFGNPAPEPRQVSASLAPETSVSDAGQAPEPAPSSAGKSNATEVAAPAGGGGQAPVSAQAPVPASAPASSPATAPAPSYPEGSAQWYAERGKALLAELKYPSALDQFNEAMKKDRNNADAYHGSALCYMNMGARGLALERFEKALTLYDPPNRAAVYNAAVANLRDNPMRAAKHIQDYLSRDGVPLDEGLHTVMGKALFSVNRQGRQHPMFAAADAFYFQYNEKLNAARTDGRKRWGSEWVPGADATAKWSRYRTARDNAERLRQEVDRATKKKTDTWDRLLDQRMGLRLHSTVEEREARQNYEQAAKAEIALRQQQQKADTEFNSVEKPPMPQVIKPIPMEPAPPPSPGLVK